MGEYLDRSVEEQYEYLVELLDEERGSAFRYGVTRFELLLEPFGLAGSVDEDVRRELFVLQQLRHVLVHRDGVADRRLVERCPSLNVKPGDTVQINHDAYLRLSKATGQYVTELIQRTRVSLGFTRWVGRPEDDPRRLESHPASQSSKNRKRKG